jgi:hypothetical protein
MPRFLRFGKTEGANKVSLNLNATWDNTFNILKVDAPAQFTTDIKEMEKGKRYQIDVTLKDVENAPLNSTLTIKTDQANQNDISVPINVFNPPKVNIPQQPGGVMTQPNITISPMVTTPAPVPAKPEQPKAKPEPKNP